MFPTPSWLPLITNSFWTHLSFRLLDKSTVTAFVTRSHFTRLLALILIIQAVSFESPTLRAAQLFITCGFELIRLSCLSNFSPHYPLPHRLLLASTVEDTPAREADVCLKQQMFETGHTALSWTHLWTELSWQVWGWAAKFRQAHKQKCANTNMKKHVNEYCSSASLCGSLSSWCMLPLGPMRIAVVYMAFSPQAGCQRAKIWNR